MKKLLAILLTLTMLCGISAFAENAQGFTAADFEGEWQCGRAFIEMYWEEEGFRVLIRWGSSAWEHTEWEYSCYYDEGSDTAVSVPFGIRTEYVYDQDGVLSSATEVYNDGEATFTLTADGYLTWNDEKENAGEGLLFEKVSGQENAPMFETIAQAFEEGEGSERSGGTEDYHIAVVKLDGQYIRIVAQKDEKARELNAAIYTADDWEVARAEYDEYAKTLPVVYTEILTCTPKTQEELDTLVGKTIGELESEGFETSSYGMSFFELEVTMNYELYEYSFIVNEPVEDYENGVDYTTFTVKSASLSDLNSYAFDLDYNADGSYNNIDHPDAFAEGLDFLQLFYEAITSGEIDPEMFTDMLKDAAPEQAEQIQMFIDMITNMSEGMPEVPAATAE